MADVSQLADAQAHNDAIKGAFAQYSEMGFKCVPIEAGSKQIRQKNWQERTFVAADFRGLANIGVQLGSVSGNLIDTDLDNAVARKIAHLFLPPTPCKFGRIYQGESDRPIASHWLYIIDGSTKTSAEWRLSKKEGAGNPVKILEYRGDNSQTVFPPSVHESAVQWIEFSGAPARVTDAELRQALGVIASILWVVASISPGTFHDAMLCVIGGYAKAGVDQEVAKEAVRCICHLSGQQNEEDRLREVTDTYKKLLEGKPILGFAALESDGWETDRIKKWLPSKLSESGRVAKDGKPKINLSRLSMEDAVNEAIAVIAGVRNDEKTMFSYGGKAVSVVRRIGNRYNDIQVATPSTDAFAHHLEKHIQFVKTDKQERVDVLVEADHRLVRRMMDASINWSMPQLTGVVACPVLLTNGKLLSDMGFCPDSGLYVGDNLGISQDEIRSMSLDEAKETILDVYQDFPFHNRAIGQSLSVACLVSTVARKAIKLAPAFIATSPYPQDGKTIWSFIPQIVATKSYANSAFSMQEEEQAKQLMTYFMSDPAALVFDNQNHRFHSQALTEMLTSGTFIGRLLGTNDQVHLHPRTQIIVNGINVRPSPEISTRAIVVQFDKRKNMKFKYPLILDHVLTKRRELVKAALKILMNGIENGKDVVFSSGASRFVEWDEFVRKAIIAAGFSDPMGSLVDVQLDDMEETRLMFVDWLFTHFPPGTVLKSADVMNKVGFDRNLEDCIKVLAHRSQFTALAVGTALSNIRGVEYKGCRFSWRRGTNNLSQGKFKPLDESERRENEVKEFNAKALTPETYVKPAPEQAAGAGLDAPDTPVLRAKGQPTGRRWERKWEKEQGEP